MPSERRVRTQAEIFQESGTQPLPPSGQIRLRGEPAGLPQLVGYYDVSSVLANIAQIEEVRASGRMLMQDKILANLQAADVPALSLARPCQGWDDLLSDLHLWHVVRLVFQRIPLPWVAGEDTEIGPVLSTSPSPGCMELVQPDGRAMYVAPPPGATLQVRQEPGITRIVAVWPDGREHPCISIVKPAA